jgi:predicted RNA binding protein YcfA (HicA-like mRNA interferase family)
MTMAKETAKPFSFRQVSRLLEQLGFVARSTPEGYQVFRHPATNALIVLPHYEAEDRVYSPHLAGIRKTLDDYYLVSSEDLDRRLAEV